MPDVRANRAATPRPATEYRYGRPWGYVEVAGILRYIKWDDVTGRRIRDVRQRRRLGHQRHLEHQLLKGKGTLRLAGVYGEGIQNYMNDAPVDIGAKSDPDPAQPFVGEALPMWSIVAFYDHTWSDKWTSSIGYSRLDMINSDSQEAAAFQTGEYALVNLLYYPTDNVMMGPELQWVRRENNSDGWSDDDFRIQFSAKCKFSASIGGNS